LGRPPHATVICGHGFGDETGISSHFRILN